MVKRYLKSGVMENGVVTELKEDSPQGENLSPLLAKSDRAAERLVESSTKYLEEMLKLGVNRKKSRTVSLFAV